MPWTTRLREAALTSPGGTRLTFNFENVSQTVEKKTTAFEFPDADGTFVQELGRSGRRYPLRAIFWGGDYDLEAEAFDSILLERGTFKLEHPLYGTVDVVPFGRITRRDDLKTAANQAIIEVTFWETIGLLFPAAQADPGSSVLSAVDEFNAAISGAYADLLGLDTAIERVTLENDYLRVLGAAQEELQGIADTQDDVRTQFNAIVDSVNAGIDILISDPLTLAFQTTQLIQAPARALTAIEARLSAYGRLTTGIIGGEGVATPGLDSRDSNAFHTADLYASTGVTGSVVSVVNNQFITKTEALAAAETILTQLTAVTNWRDVNFESLEEIDTGEAYQQLQEAVALAAGFLVEISFSLKQERSVILSRARTIIDLAAELYGSVDDQLDFLISSNNLSGSEILELPKGREIVYYV
jgi:prophage DNA circulation protein